MYNQWKDKTTTTPFCMELIANEPVEKQITVFQLIASISQFAITYVSYILYSKQRVGLFVYSTDTQFFIQLVNLAKYECIESIMYCTALIAICLLIGKYEIAALSVLASTKLNFCSSCNKTFSILIL